MARLAGTVAAFGLLLALGVSAPAALGAEFRSPYIVPVAAGSVEVGNPRTPMPDLQFTDGAGTPQRLSRWKGNVIVLNFWATWCAPCLREMASLDHLQAKAGGMPLTVITLSEDRGGAEVVKGFFARQKYTQLKPFVDPGMAASQAVEVRGLPTTFIIDKQGRTVTKVEGPFVWDNATILAQLTALAAE